MSSKIKGVTIEIGGDTTGLQNAINKVNGSVKKTQTELKEVDKLLKFNPGNADLIAQKQEVLAKQIQNTSEKLKTLKEVQSQVESQFKAGKINDEQYRAFNREVINTEQSLNNLKSQLANVGKAQQELQSKTKQLDTLFEATGTSVDQYADSLGIGLVNAIKNGKASASQLDVALAKVGKEALGSSIDIDKMKNALKSVDDGASIKAVKKDLSDVAKEAKNAGDEVNGFGENLKSVVAGLAAGGGIGAVVSKSLDTSSLNTKIDITFDVPEKSKESVRQAVQGIEAYGVDGEAALEGVRRQWALNKNASDETNAAIVKGAGVIATNYAGVDFTELIQEVNEIGSSLEITNKDALALTNALLKAGFPPEQLDTIAEYGLQMKQAGYSTAEIQAIFEKGINTKTWNIDNLNDGVKEARLRMASFGQEVPKSLSGLLKGTKVSTSQMQEWGQAVNAGGKKGSQAMSEMATWLSGIKDKTLQNALSTEIFGTKWEDQGQNIFAVLTGIQDAQDKTRQNQNALNKDMEATDNDPMVKLREAFKSILTDMQPLLTKIAELIGKFAEFAEKNSTVVSILTAVGTAIGIIIGILTALAPVFMTISSLAGALGLSFAAVAGPIGIIVAAIAGVITIGVALYKNWDSISKFLKTCWEGIKTVAMSVFNGIKTTINTIWNGIKSGTTATWNGIKSVLTTVWNGLKTGVTTAFNAIKTAITTVWNGVKSVTSTVWNAIKTLVSTYVNTMKSVIKTAFNLMKAIVTGDMNGVKSIISTVWNAAKSITSNVVNSMKDVISKVFNAFKSVVSKAMSNVKTAISNGWDKAKSFLAGINLTSIGRNIIEGLINGIKSAGKKISSAVKSIADSIPKKFKDILGIHSPAKFAFFRKSPLEVQGGLA